MGGTGRRLPPPAQRGQHEGNWEADRPPTGVRKLFGRQD